MADIHTYDFAWNPPYAGSPHTITAEVVKECKRQRDNLCPGHDILSYTVWFGSRYYIVSMAVRETPRPWSATAARWRSKEAAFASRTAA